MAKSHEANFSHSILSKAVGLACLSLSATPLTTVQAADVCGAGLTTITTAQTVGDNCLLGTGDSLQVDAPGSLTTSVGDAVEVLSGVAGSITINAGGTVSGGDDGIIVYSAAVSSGISNSGTVSGGDIGIVVDYADVDGGISNSGTISGGNEGILVYYGAVSSGISNSGTISGGDEGIFVDYADVDGGISNSGTISGGNEGIIVYYSADVSGGISNSGTISGGDVGIFVLDNSSVDSISNSGTISGGDGGIYVLYFAEVSGGISNSGTISGGDGGIVVSLGSSVDSITNSGTISGEGIDAIFVGASSTVTNGITNLAGGVIDGRVRLSNGTNLSNAGTLLLPDAGASTIDGDYTQTGNGLVSFGVSSGSSYATLTVNGTADLSANNRLAVNVSSGDTLADADVLDNVLSYGMLTATTPTVADNRALWNFSAVDDGANHIDVTAQALTVTQAAASLSNNPSLAGVAGAFDGIIAAGPSGDMATVVDTLTELNETDFVTALNQLTPSFSAGVATATLNLTGAGGSQVVSNRTAQLSGLASGDVAPDRYLWAQPFGSWTTQDERGGVDGYDANTAGIAIGTDARINNTWRLGGALSYARASVDDNTSVLDESLDIDTYQATVYASGQVLGDKTLNLQAAVGFNDNDSQRHIRFGGLNREAEADFDSWHTQLAAELVYAPYTLSPKTTMTPVVGLDYRYVEVDGYTEKGAGAANLKVEDGSEDSLVFSVGGRLAHPFTDATTLTAHLDVGHDFMADQSSVTSTFTGGGASFKTNGIEPASTVVKAGVGLTMQTQSNLEVIARYDVEARSDFDNQSLSVKVRWPF